MWTTEVGIGLWNGTHAQLVVGTRQEAGKRAGKCHRTITSRRADSNADQILLRDVAFNELLRVHFLQCISWPVHFFNDFQLSCNSKSLIKNKNIGFLKQQYQSTGLPV